MKISSSSSAVPLKATDVATESRGDVSFAQIMNNLPGASGHEQILHIEREIQNVGDLSGRQLIDYQIKVSRFGLEVELTSKIAEGGLSALRRLQSNQ